MRMLSRWTLKEEPDGFWNNRKITGTNKGKVAFEDAEKLWQFIQMSVADEFPKSRRDLGRHTH